MALLVAESLLAGNCSDITFFELESGRAASLGATLSLGALVGGTAALVVESVSIPLSSGSLGDDEVSSLPLLGMLGDVLC